MQYPTWQHDHPRIWVVNKIHTAVLNHTSRVCTERSDAQAHGHRCIPPRRITHHIRVSKARFCIRQELKSRRAKNRVLPCGVHDGFLCSEDAELLSQCAKKNESRTRTQIQRCGRQDVGEACCCAAQRHWLKVSLRTSACFWSAATKCSKAARFIMNWQPVLWFKCSDASVTSFFFFCFVSNADLCSCSQRVTSCWWWCWIDSSPHLKLLGCSSVWKEESGQVLEFLIKIFMNSL